MSLTTTATADDSAHAEGLTLSRVPAALPPRATPGGVRRTPRRQSSPHTRPWAPQPHPDGGHGDAAGNRARREVRRQEERAVRSLARIVALACVEAELGLRPARQLSQWLDLSTYDKMVRRSDLARRIRPATPGHAVTAPTALGARVSQVGPGVYEASATVQAPDRARAVAQRLERHRGRWRVTALELG